MFSVFSPTKALQLFVPGLLPGKLPWIKRNHLVLFCSCNMLKCSVLSTQLLALGGEMVTTV